MTESKIQKRRDKRIDILYKNIDHASNAYFAVESVFPIWEAAFALIIGQLIVAYFDPDICIYQQKLLAAIGLIISIIWFILVSLNLQNALHIEGKVKDLHEQLDKSISGSFDTLKFVNPWPKDKDHWTWGSIFWGTRQIADLRQPISEKKSKWAAKAIKSTWFYRRMLPFILCLTWIFFLNKYVLILVVVIIALLFYKFDPKTDLQLKQEEQIFKDGTEEL